MIILFGLLLVVGLIWFFGSFIVTQNTDAKIIQRFGRFHKVVFSGVSWKVPFIDSVVATITLKLQQLDVEVESKTKDNVFVTLKFAVQYLIPNGAVEDAYYKLSAPRSQVSSFLFDVVRSEIPLLDVDEVFSSKKSIQDAVVKALRSDMLSYGYDVQGVLVVDIILPKEVQDAMNEIQASTRLALAASQKGEADKVIVVKKAEADAMSKKLQGQGIADERQAIVEGLKRSVDDMKESLPDVSEKDVLSLLMVTQYFDTLKDIGVSTNAKVLMLNSSPSGVKDIVSQIRDSVITADQV